MDKFFEKLRGRGEDESTEFGGIWEMVGVVPSTRLFQRFGSHLDRVTTHALRAIAIVDALWVPFGMTFLSVAGREMTADALLRSLEMMSGLLYAWGTLQRLTTSSVDLPMGREYVEFADIAYIQFRSPTFWLDVVSLPGCLWWYSRSWRRLLALRLCRLWRLPSAAAQAYDTATGRGERWVVITCAELLGSIWLMCHIFACCWFAALVWTENSMEDVADQSAALMSMDVWTLYKECLRDGAMMLVGWGQPNQSVDTTGPEAGDRLTDAANVVWVMAGPVGSMYLAVVFALLLVAIERSGHAHSQHMERMGKIRAVLNSLMVPKTLKDRVLRYHAFLSVHNVDKATYQIVFEGLSANLNIEIKLCLFENLVMTAPFFEEVPPSVVMQMVMAFDEEVFSPGEMIVRKGAVGNEMFFIIKGSCEVLPDDDALLVVATKCVGDYFGEVSLVIENQRRTAWIRARTFCVLARLTRDALHECLKAEPAVKRKMLATLASYSQLAVQANSNGDENGIARELTPLLSEEKRALAAEGLRSPRVAQGQMRRYEVPRNGSKTYMPMPSESEKVRDIQQDLQELKTEVNAQLRSISQEVNLIAVSLGLALPPRQS